MHCEASSSRRFRAAEFGRRVIVTPASFPQRRSVTAPMPMSKRERTLKAMSTTLESTEAVFGELAPALQAAEALLEADRCLECGGPYAPAPCVTACPAGVDVPAFVTAIARGDPDAAATTIFEENLLGGTCARVCPVEILCEGACVLKDGNRKPIQIGLLQRYAAEHALAAGTALRMRARRNWSRVAVIGAGPAGLACAGELAARGYSVTVYDERDEPGGLVRFAIAPYRQLQDPLPEEARVLRELGVSFELGIALDTPHALATVTEFADAVVLAVGMGEDAEAPLPGDALPGVWDSLPFIEAIKTGRPPRVGSTVAVIGGGNTAMDVAREAIRLGADDVTVLYRRTRSEMPAYPHEVDEALVEGVRFEWLALPLRFIGDGRLEAVECRYARLGDPDASGRRRPVSMPGTEFRLPAETAVKAIGQRSRSEFLSFIEGLDLEDGLVTVDPSTGQTTNPKYFAAGDVTNGGATVVEAVREAKVAACGVDEWIRGGLER
jgi:glutamate synthase (NADPH/NADH) small chain